LYNSIVQQDLSDVKTGLKMVQKLLIYKQL